MHVSECAGKCDFKNQLQKRVKNQFVSGMGEEKIFDIMGKKIRGMTLEDLEITLKLEQELQLFHKLPREMVNHIFKFLPAIDRIRIERVSRFWQEVAKQSWNNFEELKMNPRLLGLKPTRRLLEYPTMNNLMLEEILKRCGRYLKKIDVNKINDDCGLSIIAEYCPNIQSINFHEVSVKGLKKLSENCKKIFEIINNGFLIYSDEINDEIENLISTNKKLKILNFKRFVGTGAFLSKLSFQEIRVIKLYCVNNDHEHNLINAIKKSKNLMN